MLLQKNKSHTYEPRLFAGDGKEAELLLGVGVFFREKRKFGYTRRGKSGFPKRSHSSRAWDDNEVAFVFTTYMVFVCVYVVFDDDHLRKRTHHRFLFFVYSYDFHFIGSLFTALSKL